MNILDLFSKKQTADVLIYIAENPGQNITMVVRAGNGETTRYRRIRDLTMYGLVKAEARKGGRIDLYPTDLGSKYYKILLKMKEKEIKPYDIEFIH